MVDCKTCEYENVCEMPDFVRNNLKLCKTHTPKVKRTNADRIRSMTDEELAEFLIRQHACDCCDYYGRGARCKAPDGFVCTNGYASAIIQKWLQSEAE